MTERQANADQEPESPSRELSQTGGVEQQHGSTSDGTSGPRPIDKAEILEKLSHLPACVALGVLTPQKANAMRGAYSVILQHVADASNTGAVGLSNDGLLELWRENPKSLNLLAPFLSQEQLDLIMRESKHEQ